jgi:DNA-binding winged helix-turn-helix (wHTH) protein
VDDHREEQALRFGFGAFLLVPNERRLVCRDVPVSLGPKLFDLLWLLVREQGRVVPRDRIVAALWPDVVVSETNLRQKVWQLRGLLRAADPAGGEYVETVPRHGYRLAAAVTRETAPREPARAGPAAPVRRRRAALYFGALPALLAVLVSARYDATVMPAPPPPVASTDPRRSVTVLRLMSHSSDDQDDWLATAFTEMLRAELAASAGLRLIPVETVERMAAELSPPPAMGLSADSLVWVRRSLGTDLVVAGSLVAAGPGPEAPLRVDLLIQCTRSHDVLAAVTRSGLRRELPLLASSAAGEVLGVLGTAPRPPRKE